MPTDSPNRHIQCNVRSCRHHCARENYCSLNTISIGACASTQSCADNIDCCCYRSKQAPETPPATDCAGDPFFRA